MFQIPEYPHAINPAQVVRLAYNVRQQKNYAKWYPERTVKKFFFWTKIYPEGYYHIEYPFYPIYGSAFIPATVYITMSNAEMWLGGWDGIQCSSDERAKEIIDALQKAVDNSIQLCQYKP